MGLLELASGASAWRGYEYYKSNRVLTKKIISDHEYSGILCGNKNNTYEVFIDTEHSRKSHCNCPHANGRHIVCKHQVALYFSAFPQAAEQYYKEILEYEAEEERQKQLLHEHILKYINSLSQEELKSLLFDILCEDADIESYRFGDED